LRLFKIKDIYNERTAARINKENNVATIPHTSPAIAIPLPSLFIPIAPKTIAKGPKIRPPKNNPTIPHTSAATLIPLPPPATVVAAIDEFIDSNKFN
tara:strand:+ start:8528 stop:8818 length:291 start_codon:yes stop_codon:yes gene_type:complete